VDLTYILENSRAFVVGWGIKVGAKTGFVIRCGRHEGREPSHLFGGKVCCDADGCNGEKRESEYLESLSGPSKRFSAVARGMAEGEGGEPRVRET
jgi:hypothetical protein